MDAAVETETVAHPLEPLSEHEIEQAVAIVRANGPIAKGARVVSVTLKEPAKDLVLSFKKGTKLEREVFLILLNNADGKTYEALVSLSDGKITSWQHRAGVQPNIMLEEFFEVEAAVRANSDWQAAMRKRGLTDFGMAMIEPWSAGYYDIKEEQGKRLLRTYTWTRFAPTDNGFAHPVENLITTIDLNTMTVVKVEDLGVVPVPRELGNYSNKDAGSRDDLKPLHIVQPEGPSFEVRGHEVSWQKWKFRIGFNSREGLVLYTLTYNDQGRERPILYRASVADMVVPYGDPRPPYYRRNAFDIGEYGLGSLANSLELGCDCLGEIRYFDAVLSNARGEAVTIKNAICLHEEDAGLLWKHFDWRTGNTEVRRSRRLVISFIATVSNYEYGFYWYLYQDGNIELEVKLTGIISNGAVAAGDEPPWGELVAPGVYGPIHQHFFNVRLDMMIDGLSNSVYEVNTEADPASPTNASRTAYRAVASLLRTEGEAQRMIDPFKARYWKIVNQSVNNRLGKPVGYKLVPGENTVPFASPDSSVIKRAGFITRHLWVTRYDPSEGFGAGDYPNQDPGGKGLPLYAADDSSVANEDIVVWYTFGAHHVVRPEDWPVMPVVKIGFMLKPTGFFDRNPSLDVPAPPSAHCGQHARDSGYS
jgi:primary-amine oxidase